MIDNISLSIRAGFYEISVLSVGLKGLTSEASDSLA